ncbi:hypothetical protein CDS [Bradyrhizobium sp.]|nr:hypothetical protein CDS [Bradyrhizobium sp.]
MHGSVPSCRHTRRPWPQDMHGRSPGSRFTGVLRPSRALRPSG